MRRTTFLIWAAALLISPGTGLATDAAPPDFSRDIAPILAKYCAGCHNGTDREGNFSMESFAELQKGGDKGAAIVPGRADASLMIRALTGEVEPAMPPKDNPRPTEKDIELLKAWVDAGAAGPAGTVMPRPELKTPEIEVAAGVGSYLTALAVSPDGKRLALGKYRRVELVDPSTKQVLTTTGQLSGKVNGVSFSNDGARFVASSGVAGLYGVATIYNTSDAKIVSEIVGHRDAIYDAELSPDGELLATCSYDRLINLWDAATGKLVRSFTGHNGAVFDLAFSPDGSLLATASADATIKIWKVKTGERLDTLGQPEGEQSAVAFSPDSKTIVAGGGDRQLRMWKLESRDKPRINPLKFSSTAHERPISELAFSPDGSKIVTASEGREVVLWDAATVSPVHRFEQQSDAVTGVAFLPGGKRIVVARIDGSWRRFALPISPKAKPIDDDRPAPVANAIAADAPPAESKEQEPNNLPPAANAISAYSVASGVIGAATENGKPDVDLFRFQARKGERLVLEIKAARSKSPLDSKLEVLDAAGNPVPRVVLQAVRTSFFTFRGHDSIDVDDFRVHAAQDMELNDYVYANGEVSRLWMLPRGPDSGFLVYPGVGASRFAFFGSTPITHALNEPLYIVRPNRPDETILPNGLPAYTLYYENDDDGQRLLGADSRVAFTAPADSDYLARVSDVRGMGGDVYHYELTVRPPLPDFEVAMDAKDLTINAGSGKEFTVTVKRQDEFDGEIRIDFAQIPPGFHVTQPLTIQAGQTFARGAIMADADAPPLTAENAKAVEWTASAMVNGKEVTKEAVKLGEMKLAGIPKILVQVLPASDSKQPNEAVAASAIGPLEVTIAPGETIPLTLKVDRRGYKGEIKFGKELAGRNLPHGVYVDNIGLNGVTLLRGESERTFFITARKWVPEQSRLFHLQAEREGNQTSWPVTLHVRKQADEPAKTPASVALAPEAN